MNRLLLILNAAEGRVQGVLLEGESCCCVQDWNAPSRGTELLTPLLANMFRHTGHLPVDLAGIACVAGPGSFTGIRLVLATAAALRRATACRLAAINYLEVLASALPSPVLERASIHRIRVLTHARRGLVHGQDFLYVQDVPVAVDEPAMLDLDGMLAAPLPDLYIGSGVTRNLSWLQERLPGEKKTLFLPGSCDCATPQALAAVTLRLPADAWLDGDIEPLYLRPCDAVDNLSAIACKRGDDPEQAHARLRDLLAQPAR